MIQTELDRLLSPSNFLSTEKTVPPTNLIEAARYSVLSGGKRFRPKLVLATCDLFQISPQLAIQPACAIELVHTYSLIHDDLPCMDNDDFRRGMLSLHKAYGEAQALLAGNFLLTYAYEILAQAPFLSAEQRLDLITTLSRHLGTDGLIGGQELDIALLGKSFNSTILLNLHRRKTASLMIAAIEFGSIISGNQHRSLLIEVAQKIGLLFQLLDDLKDHETDQDKPSAIHLLGIEKALHQVDVYYQEIKASLKLWPNSSLLQLIDQLVISCK